MAKRTPLFQNHLQHQARMVEFAGWEMPIQYPKGLIHEHHCVRNKVGLFDVSHMGEFRVKGPKALATLEWLTTNSVAKLAAHQAQYSLLPNATGGLVDDIIVYCLVPNEDYLLCVNAANESKDWEWINSNNRGAELINESEKWGQIAVQGPHAWELVSRVFSGQSIVQKPFHITPLQFNSQQVLLASTGYTGEAGCEIFVPSALTPTLWERLLELGADLGVEPIGLGARDTLRTEMKYSLYGHEIDDQTNPFEAELGWVVKPSAKDFLGKELILQQREAGLQRKLVGFVPTERGIPRQGYALLNAQGEKIGVVTSGTHSPTLDKPIGIGYVAAPFSSLGEKILIDVRGRSVPAVVCATPFVQVQK